MLFENIHVLSDDDIASFNEKLKLILGKLDADKSRRSFKISMFSGKTWDVAIERIYEKIDTIKKHYAEVEDKVGTVALIGANRLHIQNKLFEIYEVFDVVIHEMLISIFPQSKVPVHVGEACAEFIKLQRWLCEHIHESYSNKRSTYEARHKSAELKTLEIRYTKGCDKLLEIKRNIIRSKNRTSLIPILVDLLEKRSAQKSIDDVARMIIEKFDQSDSITNSNATKIPKQEGDFVQEAARLTCITNQDQEARLPTTATFNAGLNFLSRRFLRSDWNKQIETIVQSYRNVIEKSSDSFSRRKMEDCLSDILTKLSQFGYLPERFSMFLKTSYLILYKQKIESYEPILASLTQELTRRANEQASLCKALEESCRNIESEINRDRAVEQAYQSIFHNLYYIEQLVRDPTAFKSFLTTQDFCDDILVLLSECGKRQEQHYATLIRAIDGVESARNEGMPQQRQTLTASRQNISIASAASYVGPGVLQSQSGGSSGRVPMVSASDFNLMSNSLRQ